MLCSKSAKKINNILYKSIIIGMILILSLHQSIAAELINIPNSIQPDIITRSLNDMPLKAQSSAPELKQAAPLHMAAKPTHQGSKIKLKLNKIILEGNTVFSTAELSKIFTNQLHNHTDFNGLLNIVNDITNYYRAHGYILARAILPPQHISNGVVIIRVIEGFIAQVNLVGKTHGTANILTTYGAKIRQKHPIDVKTLEDNILLANEIPGTKVKLLLAPSKTTFGAADVNLLVEHHIIEGYLSYDNYGTRYIGPQQATAALNANSIFQSGDSTQVTFSKTPKGKELTYLNVTYHVPLDDQGIRLIIGGNESQTKPLFMADDLKLMGNAKNYYLNIKYPIIRNIMGNLYLDAGFNYLDTSMLTMSLVPIYKDHLRTLSFGVSGSLIDQYAGNNSFYIQLKKGCSFLGASKSADQTSRAVGSANFGKLNFQISRLQYLFAHISVFSAFQGQYSSNSMFTEEQFGFGGSQVGRGYDAAEISGDKGISAVTELRLDFLPNINLINTIELYYFYDAGVMWNNKISAQENSKTSATATGIGTRFAFSKNVIGNLMVAQPLTKPINSLSLMGRGRAPRMLFSITAILN